MRGRGGGERGMVESGEERVEGGRDSGGRGRE